MWYIIRVNKAYQRVSVSMGGELQLQPKRYAKWHKIKENRQIK